MRFTFIAEDEQGVVAISQGTPNHIEDVLSAFATFLRNIDFPYVAAVGAMSDSNKIWVGDADLD